MLMEPTTQTHALRERKEKALALFQQNGLPDKQHEEYKYCDITRHWDNAFDTLPQTSKLTPESMKDIAAQWQLGEESHLFVFINGALVSFPEQEIPGIRFGEKDASAEDSNPAAGSIARPEDDPLLAKHYSEITRYFFLDIASNTRCDKTLVFLHISDASQPCGISLHKSIQAGPVSEVSVKQIYCNTGASKHLVHTTDEWNLMPSAIIHNLRIQQESSEAVLVHHSYANIQADASMSDYVVTLSGKLVRNNTVFRLNGKNAQSHLYGLYLTGDQMLTDNHTLVDHRVSDCYSNELYKGILDGKSTAVFNGKIFVRKDAQKTNAYQSNKNILLSPQSTINTKPQLEIFADDVKCSHGTSTGKLDETAMYYLKSRGIGEAKARRLLLMAFAEDMAEKIPSENNRAMLRGILETRLG